jgi:hypothetical protein
MCIYNIVTPGYCYVHSLIPQWKWSTVPPRMNPPGGPVHSLIIHLGRAAHSASQPRLTPPWWAGIGRTCRGGFLFGRQVQTVPARQQGILLADWCSLYRPTKEGSSSTGRCTLYRSVTEESSSGSRYRLHHSAKRIPRQWAGTVCHRLPMRIVIPPTKYLTTFDFPTSSYCHMGSGYTYIFEYTSKRLEDFQIICFH